MQLQNSLRSWPRSLQGGRGSVHESAWGVVQDWRGTGSKVKQGGSLDHWANELNDLDWAMVEDLIEEDAPRPRRSLTVCTLREIGFCCGEILYTCILFFCFKKKRRGAVEMAEHLRALTIFAEGSQHLRGSSQSPVIPVTRDLMPFWPPQAPGTHSIHSYSQANNHTHVIKTNTSFKRVKIEYLWLLSLVVNLTTFGMN